MTRPVLPIGCSDRGAQMGRRPIKGDPDPNHPHKFYLRNILRDAYDEQGAYWGLGDPVFWATTGDLTTQLFVRAQTRQRAKQLILTEYPNARFFR